MGVCKRLKEIVHEARTKDKCFNEHKNKNGVCYGMYDPSPMQGNLNIKCMDCPHLTVYIESEG